MHQRPAWTSTGAGQHALLDHVVSASVGPGALAVKGSVLSGRRWRPRLAAASSCRPLRRNKLPENTTRQCRSHTALGTTHKAIAPWLMRQARYPLRLRWGSWHRDCRRRSRMTPIRMVLLPLSAG
jgi:hypothetical protein